VTVGFDSNSLCPSGTYSAQVESPERPFADLAIHGREYGLSRSAHEMDDSVTLDLVIVLRKLMLSGDHRELTVDVLLDCLANRRGVDRLLGTQADMGVIAGDAHDEGPAALEIAESERVLREIHPDGVLGEIPEGLLEVPLVALTVNRDQVLDHLTGDVPVSRPRTGLRSTRCHRGTTVLRRSAVKVVA
jgi:hypothetical protein